MTLLITLAAFLAALELLVAIHEGGHFAAARLCGVKVLRFSLGFGPVLWKRRNRRGTEFALSLLPLGGYVKMLDSRDPGCLEEARAHPEGDFNRKRLWQRALIVFAGPFMNLALAVALFWVMGVMGSLELSSRVAEPEPGTPAAAAGVKGGQYVTELGGMPVSSFIDLQMKLMRCGAGVTTITVRSGEDAKGERASRYEIDLRGVGFDKDPAKSSLLREAGLLPWTGPVTLAEVMPGSAAEKAGLRAGDQVLAADGRPVSGADALVRVISARAGGALRLRVQRGAEAEEVTVAVPEARDEGDGRRSARIGVRISARPDLVLVRQGPGEALVKGVSQLWDVTAVSLEMMGRMIAGEASVKNLSGPVAIADYAGKAARAGLHAYLYFLAMISVSLGVLNLLPVPLLDGGHLALYAWELAAGRRPPERAVAIAQRLGLALLGLMMALALFNDIARLLGG